jgi:hypothetical protein
VTGLLWRRDGVDEGRICCADGHQLAKYSWGPASNHPFFYDVRPMGHHGVLTNHAPWDHPWHHGLWWAWKYINNALYWEDDASYGGGAPRGLGRSRVVRHSVSEAAGALVVEESVEWREKNSRTKVLDESRTLTIGTRGENWYIDWDLGWTAVEHVAFTVTPYPEFDWGGYAGLNYRPARSMAGGETLLAPSGETGRMAVHSQPVSWAAYLGSVDDAGTGEPDAPATGGVALFGHPGNTRHPMPGYAAAAADDFGFLALAPLMRHPLALETGQHLKWRFRSLVLGHATDAEELQASYDAYVNTS